MVVLKRVPEIKISYRTPKEFERWAVTKSSDAYQALTQVIDWNTIEFRESFYTLFMNRANHVLGYFMNSTGGVAGTVVDVKQVLGIACKANCSSLVLSHNHCSGNLQPSQQDIDITKRILKACEFMDVKVLDHIIITPNDGYFSFADESMLF